jgi:hypothetical protein
VWVQGHGLVRRQQRGPPGPEEAARTQVVRCRRYRCTACRAVLTVLPASAVPSKHFSGAAIALALALWGVVGLSACKVRQAVNDWKHLGAAARGWRTLVRWASQVATGKLFASLGVCRTGRPREAAARAAQALCGWAPPQERGMALPWQAFSGASHVS